MAENCQRGCAIPPSRCPGVWAPHSSSPGLSKSVYRAQTAWPPGHICLLSQVRWWACSSGCSFQPGHGLRSWHVAPPSRQLHGSTPLSGMVSPTIPGATSRGKTRPPLGRRLSRQPGWNELLGCISLQFTGFSLISSPSSQRGNLWFPTHRTEARTPKSKETPNVYSHRSQAKDVPSLHL